MYFTFFQIQEPKEIVLGTHHKKVRKGNKMRDVLTEDCTYYIPLLASLQQLLNNESVLEEVRKLHK